MVVMSRAQASSKCAINTLCSTTRKRNWLTVYYSSMFSKCSSSFGKTRHAINVLVLWLVIYWNFCFYGGLWCFDTGFWFSGLTLFHISQVYHLQVPYRKDCKVLTEKYFPCEAVLTSTDTCTFHVLFDTVFTWLKWTWMLISWRQHGVNLTSYFRALK